MTASECPQWHLHTDGPKGYLEWHAFAEEMAATHVQEPCTGLCGKLIWVPATDTCTHPTVYHDPGSGCPQSDCECQAANGGRTR